MKLLLLSKLSHFKEPPLYQNYIMDANIHSAQKYFNCCFYIYLAANEALK